MSDWKGPWKCEKCNRVFAADMLAEDGNHWNPKIGACHGKLIPLDRRQIDGTANAPLKSHWPRTFDKKGHPLAPNGERYFTASDMRSAFVAGVEWALTLGTHNSHDEAEALRRYPE